MSQVSKQAGIITMINGPVLKAKHMAYFTVREMVTVGSNKLIGEVISLDGDIGTIQVYEETEGLMAGEEVYPTGRPLSVRLGPGMVGNIFDGIQRPLSKIREISTDFIPTGIGMMSIDEEKLWEVQFVVQAGQELKSGEIFGEVQETSVMKHRLMVPEGVCGRILWIKPPGAYCVLDVLMELEEIDGKRHPVTMAQYWPVRIPRPVTRRMPIQKLLVTGQRVLDIFFPIAKGGTVAVPGGFGTGKTVTQHQLAKWSDADMIVYVGCGERGNEMTDVLEEFPKIIDPRSGKAIMERTILIANTSNMPVAAREASIYTGITIAEYFRDMGYHVAIMADSTSRWAEALREISGRLEEMPAEEGYPAYLPSRLAEFYERAGYVETLSRTEGSVTIIGAVSPPGGDFSEPVTENTRRFVSAFLALDRNLAYARHYPAINYLTSYSGYVKLLENWYALHVGQDALLLRAKMLKVLQEESKLLEIVQLVGEDVLPDDQRLLLEVAKVIKRGFLQQNALHKEDTYVALPKQYKMLKAMDHLYTRAAAAVKSGIPIGQVKDEALFDQVIKMKYTVPNDQLQKIDELIQVIDDHYNDLQNKYK